MNSHTDLIVQGWSFAIFILAVLGVAGLMLGVSHLLGGRARGDAKEDPFESGVVAVGASQMRFSAKFYLVAMFFVLFDLESVFLYAWAVSVRGAGWAGFIEAATFIVILLIGLVYIWRLGGLDWGPASRKRRQARTEASTHPVSR